MKYFSLIVFTVLLLGNSVSFCQEKGKIETIWMPENYVEALIEKDTINADKYIIPIEGFITSSTGIQILTYKGEVSPIKSQKFKQNNIEKELLLNLEYYINLKYLSREWANKIANSKFFLSREGDKLLLEIRENNTVEKIYFIKSINGYEFEGFREVKRNLRSTH